MQAERLHFKTKIIGLVVLEILCRIVLDKIYLYALMHVWFTQRFPWQRSVLDAGVGAGAVFSPLLVFGWQKSKPASVSTKGFCPEALCQEAQDYQHSFFRALMQHWSSCPCRASYSCAEQSFTCVCACLQQQKSLVRSTGGRWASSTRWPSPLGSWSLMPLLTPSLTGGGCSWLSPCQVPSSCSTTGKRAFVLHLPTTWKPASLATPGLTWREIWHCFLVVRTS